MHIILSGVWEHAYWEHAYLENLKCSGVNYGDLLYIILYHTYILLCLQTENLETLRVSRANH